VEIHHTNSRTPLVSFTTGMVIQLSAILYISTINMLSSARNSYSSLYHRSFLNARSSRATLLLVPHLDLTT